jgi:putative ABC transport system permease protein
VFLWDQYNKAELRAGALRDFMERMAAVPGVVSVGAVSAMPFALANIGIETPFAIEGRPKAAVGEAPSAFSTVASNGYFEAMGVGLKRGRTFSAADNATGAKVAIVSESFVKRNFPNEDPIGKRIAVRFDGGQTRYIIGIVADVRHDDLQRPPREEVYLPHAQFPFGSMTIVVKTAGDASPLLEPLQKALWAVNPNQAIYAASTVDALVAGSLRERRFNLTLIGGFAALAVVLAAVGVYGLISYSTSRRAREFGVRLALGANARQIIVAAMGDGFRSATLGVAVGLVAAYALTRSLSTMLFDVTATDPITFASLAVVMLVVAALASYLPARKALRVDPVIALRGEG